MADVSKYATANVDKERYYNFKKACQQSDLTILEAFNMIMDKFMEEHA